MPHSSISQLLLPHLDTMWLPDSPVTPEAIEATEAALGCRFPDDYRDTLLAGDESLFLGTASRVLLLPLRQLRQFNPDERAAPNLRQMIIFGEDKGDNFFFFDPENRLGHGKWAVFAVEMGMMDADDSVFIAKDFRELVERVLRGEELF